MTLALKTILTNLRQSCLRRSRWKMAAHWGVIPCLILGIASFSAFASETGFMSASDLNGDLLSDLAILDENGNGILLENQGSGTLKPVDSFYAHSKNVGNLSMVDFSKDGSMDLLLLYPHDSGIEWVAGTAFDQNQSSFLTGFGVEPISLDASRSNISVAAVGYEQTAKISLLKVNSQSSTLEWVQEWNTDYPVPDLIWVDLDGDGFEELVTLQKKNETTAILTAFDQASMDIQSPWVGTLLSQWETSVLDHVVSGQFTPDSLLDLLVWSSGKEAFLVIATGNNVFETKAVTLEESSMIEIGDLNQDGLDDIVLVSPEGDAVNVYLNGGDASFQSHAFPGVSGNVVGVAIGSFTTANQKDVFLWTSASDANAKLSDPHSVSLQALNTASLSLYQFLNGNVEKIGEANLPTLGNEDAVFQNVVIYKKSDLDQGRYFPYRSYFVEDWTTGASAINAGQVEVKHEILQDGALVAAPDVTLGGLDFLVNFADYEAHTNQMNAQESEFLFGKPVLPRSLRMEAAPPSGSYHLPVVVTPSSDTGASLFYRIDGGSWQSYVEGSTEIILTEDTVVSFYAALGSLLSPVIDMNYQVSIPPHSDSDVDEIPDLLEMAFGLPIYSATKDLDNDGWYDLDELVRATDPKNKTNFPVDSDLDGWSDIDEALRQTNPTDPTSHPVVSGLTDGEFLLYLGSTLKTTPNDDAAIVSDGSILDVRNFTNNRIASATFTNTQWSLRLPGNNPLWLRIRDKNANTVVLTYYAASHLPCWLPLQLFDGSQTSDQWITLLQQQAASEVLEQRVDSITTRSLAASLALQIWLLQETGKTQPIAWGDGGQGFTPDELETVKAEYDLDTVYQYLFTTLEDGNPWVTLVKQFLESTRSAPLAQDWDLTLQQWALGIAVDPTLLPPSITPDAYTLAQANLTALFAGIPDRIVELTGTILIENGQTILQDGDGKNWVVDFGGLNLQTGTPITIRGLQEKLCSKGDDIVIHVQEALDYQPTVVFNTDDTDNDNLPDQWEEYFFASLSANPSDDPDNDGADNSSELIAYTSPIDSDSVPNVTPTPTVTPLPEATPTVTPLPEPTATPTPLPGLSKPTPVISYNFTQTSFADAGLSEIPGGFTGGYPAGESSMGDIPVDANAGVTDGKGLIFTCDPGEVQLVISLPTVNVGPDPVLIRCKAMATSSQGRFALAAVDGSLDNSVISLIPSDTQHLLNQYKQISLIYEPTASQTVSAVVQLYTPDTSSETVIVYVDDLEVIPLTTGTAIVQSDVSLAIDITNDGNVTETEKPIVSQVYSFQANDLLSNGYVEIAGGFEPGAIPGQIQLSGTPFGWTPLSSDGRGVLMSCDPGETAMIMASPALTVGNQPVILRAYVRANSPEGAFALVALDGSLDGSLTSLIPGNTAFMQNQFTRISILYEPTKTDTLAPLMQLHVPSSALGPVSVFIDQLEVIPFIPNTYIEPEDIGMD